MAEQYADTRARQEVLKALKGAIGKQYAPGIDELSTPPNPKMGDIAFGCFSLAKGLERNPAEVAVELAAKVSPEGIIDKVEAMGPYVNITLNTETYATDVINEVLVAGDKYGNATFGEGRDVMVEYANFNTHKEIHVGHLRNMVVGIVTINLLKASGHNVIAASYLNDLGNNVAKCLWAIDRFHKDDTPEKGDEINFLGAAYTEATRALEKDESAKEEVSEIQRSLEEKKGDWQKLWKKTRQWSVDAIYDVYKQMGLPIDVQYYESDLLESTKKIVRTLQDDGLAVESQGAIIVDLEDEGYGVNLLVKSDGTHLYNAKDLALAERKQRDYELDRSLIVVDKRQSLAMNQLFATLKRMGVSIPYEHMSYGFVTLPDGAMSSRKGNIVRFEDLYNTLKEAAVTGTRERHPEWSKKQVDKTADAIAHAAMVYAIAKQSPHKDIVFNIDEAIAFEGMSGPYLLYTVSRIESLLEKARVKPAFTPEAIDNQEARDLVKMIARYPRVLRESADELSLGDVPQYAFELAQAFSAYYGSTRIIDEDEKARTAGRLALAKATLVTLSNTLAIMGIEPVKDM